MMETNYDNIVLDTALIDDIMSQKGNKDAADNHKRKKQVPGQQIGLYNDGTAHDVRQMVEILNNPGESSQDDRG